MEITGNDYAQYSAIFQNAGPVNGVLRGESARNVLVQSNLPSHQLGAVWELADMDRDGALDQDEFCVAMKLVYLILGGQLLQLPTQLPPQLIPQTKAHLFRSNQQAPAASTGYVSGAGGGPAAAAAVGPSAGEAFTWYIPPTERSTYEARFNQFRRGAETVSLLYLNDFLRQQGLPWDQVVKYWNLVDVRKLQVLNKEQFIILLHILAFAARGVPIPPTLPASIQDIIQNSLKLNDSLRYTAATSPTGVGSSPASNSSPGLFGQKSKNVTLADGYLSKLGGSTYGAKSTFASSTTGGGGKGSTVPSSAAAILDEEQKLRAELKSLESQIERAEQTAERTDKLSTESTSAPSATIKELTDMLAYKEQRKDEIATRPYQLRDQMRQREHELDRHRAVLRDVREAVAVLNQDKAYLNRYLEEGREKLRGLEAQQ